MSRRPPEPSRSSDRSPRRRRRGGRRGPAQPDAGAPGSESGAPPETRAAGAAGSDGAHAAGEIARRRPRSAPAPEGETFRGLVLNDFQRQALGPLREGRSVLLAAPTGAGKTLVAEMAIEQSIQRGRRAIYTAPVKALSNQKYRDFKAIDPAAVGIMTGDVTINPSARLIIMTTEIFRNTIFENPASLDDVDVVVFDEIHYMDDPERGTVWEESIIFAPPHIRFVCLSATISNLDLFGEWISRTRGETVEVIRHRERPVPLDHYLFFPGAGLRRIKDGKVRFPAAAFPARGRGGRGRGGRTGGDRNAVLDVLARDGNLPVLFFCFSRRECERRALETVRGRQLLEGPAVKRIEALFDDVCSVFELSADPELEELRSLVRHGVAFHHAGMLPLHKELVERLFTSGLLQALFATETFSLGINMPARTVVFASLRKFDGVGFSSLKVREYQQMAGRAGRQGIDDAGLVISIVDDARVQPRDIERLIGNDVEPVQSRFNLSYSTLVNLHRTLGDRIYEAWERSFNNFQWARMSRRKRERNEARQRAAIGQRLAVLRDLGYITAEGTTPKGDIAASINGYELAVVELLDSGLLRYLDEIQLAIVFAALVFEERKNDLFRRLTPNVLGPHRRDVEAVVAEIIRCEKERGITDTIKPPNFKIGSVIHRWCMGDGFDEIREDTTAPAGDLVRVMRLTVQLLRQLRHALPRHHDLGVALDRARDLLDRDAVDAARQLSLG